MATRNVFAEILSLVELVNAPGEGQPSPPVTVDEVEHFIAGLSGVGSIEIPVAEDTCAVVVCIEQFNADDSSSQTATQSEMGTVVTEALVSQWQLGADVFFVFRTGKGKINLTATPQGGFTYFARAWGFFLPHRALARLSRMSTKILS